MCNSWLTPKILQCWLHFGWASNKRLIPRPQRCLFSCHTFVWYGPLYIFSWLHFGLHTFFINHILASIHFSSFTFWLLLTSVLFLISLLFPLLFLNSIKFGLSLELEYFNTSGGSDYEDPKRSVFLLPRKVGHYGEKSIS